MKSADITPGWYKFDANPTGRYGRQTKRVYVFGKAGQYDKGTEYFVKAASDDEEAYREVADPINEGVTLRVSKDVLYRRTNNSNQTYWLVGEYMTNQTDYVEDEHGELVEGPDGDWLRQPVPDFWKFAVVRSTTIIMSWSEHEAQKAARKAWQAEEAKREQARRAARAEENVALVDALAEYGLELLDVLDATEAKQVVNGVDGARTRTKIDEALRLARKVAAHVAA